MYPSSPFLLPKTCSFLRFSNMAPHRRPKEKTKKTTKSFQEHFSHLPTSVTLLLQVSHYLLHIPLHPSQRLTLPSFPLLSCPAFFGMVSLEVFSCMPSSSLTPSLRPFLFFQPYFPFLYYLLRTVFHAYPFYVLSLLSFLSYSLPGYFFHSFQSSIT